MKKIFLILACFASFTSAFAEVGKPSPNNTVLHGNGAERYHHFTPPNHLRFPGMEKATRVVSLKFKADEDALNKTHMFFSFPVYKNSFGVANMRGVVVGSVIDPVNIPNNCPYPTIHFESLSVVKLRRNQSPCPKILPNTTYRLDMHVSRTWIAYWLYRVSPIPYAPTETLVEADGMDATAAWESIEKMEKRPTYNPYYKDFLAALVPHPAYPSASAQIFDVKVGHYMNR